MAGSVVMEQYLSVSRAARLVGVSRGQLQKKIRMGELGTFEGNVQMADLQRVFPDVDPYHDTEYDRVREIKSKAFSKRVHELLLPDAEVLFERLNELSVELSNARGQFSSIKRIVAMLKAKLLHAQSTESEQERGLATSLHEWVSRELDPVIQEAEMVVPLLVQNSLLRLVTAHVKLSPSGHEFFVEGNNSILDSATKAGLSMPYGCVDGSCGLCKARITEGHIKKIMNYSFLIPEEDQVAGYALMCANTAVSDIQIAVEEITQPDDLPFQTVETDFKSYKPLSSNVSLLIVLSPPSNRFRFLAGQRAELRPGKDLIRTMPLASCPCDERQLLFHINHADNQLVAALSSLRPGQHLSISGPYDDFVLNTESSRASVFIAYETGFAPVNSLIEHAIALNMSERIDLFWVARTSDGHYLSNLCRAWHDALDDFSYTPLILPEELDCLAEKGDLHKLLTGTKRDYLPVSECDYYIAGPELFVDMTCEYLEKSGALLDNIRSTVLLPDKA
ncbi:MAG TPA: 2Fe-2S iron-sulfur cluster binding domain-containing protein [Gammaproteobacteria bacterium]|nr:2Fe-2S iron-sulfur cluster binding domain-containing protein [Gammaproteobacteria bacterium]